mmetsp:Transcript_108169/g.316290  ORF Transcript_108169/g.316290 Transcript_108169/m.316290 type:complete len:702 (-) Transcript_108169:74-2179(-)
MVPLLRGCGSLCAATAKALEKQDVADAAPEVAFDDDEGIFPSAGGKRSTRSVVLPGLGTKVEPPEAVEEEEAKEDEPQPQPEPPPQAEAPQPTPEPLNGPSQHEVDRGVHIERVYDFYDPVKKRLFVLDVDESVIHRRRPRTRRATSENRLGGPGFEMGRTDSEVSCVGQDRVAELSKATELCSPPWAWQRSLSNITGSGNWERGVSEPEVYTLWGVFVGKLLHSKLLDFNTVTHKAVDKVRFMPSKGSTRVMEHIRERADIIYTQAQDLMKSIGDSDEDIPDSEWSEGDLLTRLFSTEYVEALTLLAKAVRKIIAAQPVLAKASVPCRVFGDIHGQLRDLLLLLHAFGDPRTEKDLHVVFNGDFVDRGSHQLAVIGLLFAMKVAMPKRVWLVRGNHEDRTMNDKYGFKDECLTLLGPEVGKHIYDTIQETFAYLPLACSVADRVLTVHGGLGDGIWNLEDLSHVPRPLNETRLAQQSFRWIQSILWSDPIEDSQSDKRAIFGVHASPRGKTVQQFGWNVTKTFCARNGLGLVIRSHQSKQNSPGFEVMHEHLLVRVFSARDYEGHGNDGAVLLISPYKGEEGKGPAAAEASHLSVRPQVLGSVTKARAQREQKEADRVSRQDSRRKTSPTSERAGPPQRSRASSESSSGTSSSRSSSSKSTSESSPRSSTSSKSSASSRSSSPKRPSGSRRTSGKSASSS